MCGGEGVRICPFSRFKEAEQIMETKQTKATKETKQTKATKDSKQTKENTKTVWFLLPRGGLRVSIIIKSSYI